MKPTTKNSRRPNVKSSKKSCVRPGETGDWNNLKSALDARIIQSSLDIETLTDSLCLEPRRHRTESSQSKLSGRESPLNALVNQKLASRLSGNGRHGLSTQSGKVTHPSPRGRAIPVPLMTAINDGAWPTSSRPATCRDFCKVS